ncbi:uncharacterized protein LOC113098640 [Carassius auratus]|uniref:Uncharacterized protein LOC113098640 n=1 Tax=Carassius auratus TaxID=7957 RepID=A0A6P6PED6_CARAU|nr:uncharacterized protein LOC113098640 [Carassius auratus]
MRENPFTLVTDGSNDTVQCQVKQFADSVVLIIGILVFQISGFDPEHLAVDVGYWFKGSTNRKGYLAGEKLNIGFTTRATLNRLLEAGDITPQEVHLFQQAAFLVRAVEYWIKKLSLKEALLKHAQFLDVQQRTECGVEDALYFVDRFQELLPFSGPEEQDKDKFLEYQLMDIPMPQDPTTFNVEEFWGSMSSIKCKVSGLSLFGRLSKIASLVLVLSHSNGDAERVFSIVGLNKTKTKNSLALDGTLSSIMTDNFNMFTRG